MGEAVRRPVHAGARALGFHAAALMQRGSVAFRYVAVVALLAAPAAVAACGGSRGPVGSRVAPAPRTSGADAALVPAGYGTLRQEDVAIRMRLPGVQVRVIPLEEGVLRLLSPDSYAALSGLREGNARALARLAARRGERDPSLWYVSYFGLEPDARISPSEVVIASGGREYRPLDILPLGAGFGDGRLGQREVRSGIYLFPGDIIVTQPLTVTVESNTSTSWNATLALLERERAAVRSRAAQERP